VTRVTRQLVFLTFFKEVFAGRHQQSALCVLIARRVWQQFDEQVVSRYTTHQLPLTERNWIEAL
jgi:hypothetical protein